MTVQRDHKFDGKHLGQTPFFQAWQHPCSTLCVCLCESAANSPAKKGTEHHEPKPATRDAHGRAKAATRSSSLSRALQQWELYNWDTHMPSLQLLPRMWWPNVYICSRTASCLEKNGQNELDCAVDMHQWQGTSFRKGTHSWGLNPHNAPE